MFSFKVKCLPSDLNLSLIYDTFAEIIGFVKCAVVQKNLSLGLLISTFFKLIRRQIDRIANHSNYKNNFFLKICIYLFIFLSHYHYLVLYLIAIDLVLWWSKCRICQPNALKWGSAWFFSEHCFCLNPFLAVPSRHDILLLSKSFSSHHF